MKNDLKRICTAFIALVVIIAAVPQADVSAATGQPAIYSKQYNSGQRDVVCTSLSGTSASSYYTGSYTYENLSELSASSLKTSLNTLMTSTHKKMSTYDDCRDKATITDCEENDSSHFTTFYTSYSATYGQYNKGNGWNREHVWPKSLGGFETSGPGADLHHIRPTETQTNSDRGNLKYGNVSSGTSSKGNLSGIVGGTKGTYYEPLDNVKGDVARIILYVHVRYYTTHSQCASVTNVFQSVDVLLDWMELDPVDTWEMGRNEVVQDIQGNRNVFIDYPEYAWLLFNEDVPANIKTPSMSAWSDNTVGGSNDATEAPVEEVCEHIETKLVGYVSSDCINTGYSGDTCCASCNTILFSGIPTAPTGEHVWGEWRHEIGAIVEKRGCRVCGETQEREYVNIGDETEADTETGSQTESSDETEMTTATEIESNTEVETETETETETKTYIDGTQSETTEQTEDITENNEEPTHTESVSDEPMTQGSAESESGDVDIGISGCQSSLADGTVIISVIFTVGFLAFRKNKE